VNRKQSEFRVLAIALLVVSGLLLFIPASAQSNKKNNPTAPLLTRTTTRHETYRLSYGGSVTISSAPTGSLIVEGWQRNEVDISATIELQAPSAADLDQLATVNNFFVDEDLNHIRILTSGTHDRAFMKRTARNFPKSLIGLPWKIDYHIKVPGMTDLAVDAGNGPVKLSGVEGAIRLNSLNGDADLSLTGGLVAITVQSGTVNVRIPSRGWHGLGAEIRLAAGSLNLELMPGFSADINADVLRTGGIRNTFPELSPRERTSMTAQSIRARAGSGGATLSFTVGDGTILIKQKEEDKQ
jgi:hypothetical protein